MNTPVVDDKGNVIGDLILFASDWNRQFQRHAVVPSSVAAFNPKAEMPSCTSTMELVTFTHNRICSRRPGESPYVLKVVVADRPNLLMLVRGYRTIAECWGEEVNDQSIFSARASG